MGGVWAELVIFLKGYNYKINKKLFFFFFFGGGGGGGGG